MPNITFHELIFDKPGVYSYTVREHETGEAEWSFDNRSYKVIITVADTGDGELSAAAEYPDGEPVFINHRKRRCYLICLCCRRLCGECLWL